LTNPCIGVVLVLDEETGLPRAMVDGTAVIAVRTAAVSAVATDLPGVNRVSCRRDTGTAERTSPPRHSALTSRGFLHDRWGRFAAISRLNQQPSQRQADLFHDPLVLAE
jgi:hypothetical protein